MKLSDDLPARWIVIKGLLFMIILLTASLLTVFEGRVWMRAVLVAMVIWSSARLYYFCFYVIEKYIDAEYKFSGVFSALQYFWKSRRSK